MRMDFGKTFKQVRIQKGLTLRQVSGTAISESQLSRFENGKSMLTADHFFKCLAAVNISAGEFQALMEKEENAQKTVIQRTIRQLTNTFQFSRLQEMAEELKQASQFEDDWQHHSYYLIQGVLWLNQEQSPKDETGKSFYGQMYLERYFFQIQEWTLIEINDYLQLFPLLSVESVCIQSQTILRKIKTYPQKSVYFRFLLSLFSYYVYHGEITLAEKIQEIVEKESKNNDSVMGQILVIFHQGILAKIMGDEKQCDQKFDTALSLCRILKQNELAKTLRRRRKRWNVYPDFVELVTMVELFQV